MIRWNPGTEWRLKLEAIANLSSIEGWFLEGEEGIETEWEWEWWEEGGEWERGGEEEW